MSLQSLDISIISFFHRIGIPVGRFSVFVVFFWFGILKVLGLSPASPLVQALFEATISIMPFATFIVLFGIFEMLIGVLFLFSQTTRIVIPLLFIHLVTTVMPLFILPETAWSGFLVPTLEGQYIIKNVLIVALAIVISGNLTPLRLGRHSVYN